jgi:hypothetical protein
MGSFAGKTLGARFRSVQRNAFIILNAFLTGLPVEPPSVAQPQPKADPIGHNDRQKGWGFGHNRLRAYRARRRLRDQSQTLAELLHRDGGRRADARAAGGPEDAPVKSFRQSAGFLPDR